MVIGSYLGKVQLLPTSRRTHAAGRLRWSGRGPLRQQWSSSDRFHLR